LKELYNHDTAKAEKTQVTMRDRRLGPNQLHQDHEGKESGRLREQCNSALQELLPKELSGLPPVLLTA
jgi:hypothetical protein